MLLRVARKSRDKPSLKILLRGSISLRCIEAGKPVQRLSDLLVTSTKSLTAHIVVCFNGLGWALVDISILQLSRISVFNPSRSGYSFKDRIVTTE